MQEYLRRSRVAQRRVRWLCLLGALVTLALGLAGARATFYVGASTAIVAAGGLWITQARIAEFERALRRRG